MIVHLERYSYGKHETEGVLTAGSLELATIERPWIPNPNGAKGGKPFESCIPDGMYRMADWDSPSKGLVFLIWNPDLGVHRSPEDHPKDEERDLCLIHKGNWAHDVEGCIAVGLARKPMDSPSTPHHDQAVQDSAVAMHRLRDTLGTGQHILSITSVVGASDA